MYTAKEQKILVSLARQSIEHFLVSKKKLQIDTAAIPKNLQEKRACFVTLKKDLVELRGCIGSLGASRPLYVDVAENAYSAAFEDDRFFPVTQEELSEIQIEISILTPAEPLSFSSSDDLLDKLRVGVDGVVVSRGTHSATYLPQVWDEILNKNDFLSSLCLKAGLAPDDWRKPGLAVFVYQVEIIGED